MILHQVETIMEIRGVRIQRMCVPGGWLYLTFSPVGVTTAFVPYVTGGEE